MLITILSPEYLDISAKCRCWGRLSELISSRWWYCSVGQQVQTGGRRSKLVTRKQFMRSTHSLLQIISRGGPGLVLLQLYRQLLPRNIITRLGFIMSTEHCNWYKNTSHHQSDQTSSGHWENHAIPHFIIIMMNCHCTVSDLDRYFWFVTIFDILLIWKSNCLSRWRRIKILIILFLKSTQ